METNHDSSNSNREPDISGPGNNNGTENSAESYNNPGSGYNYNTGYPYNGYNSQDNKDGYNHDSSNNCSFDNYSGRNNADAPGGQNGNQNNNYYNYTEQPYAYSPPFRLPGNGFSTAAMVLGILAILSTLVLPLYLPFIFGSLAILFALLSKGNADKLSGKAIAGATCGTVGIGLNAAIFTASLFFLLSQPELMIEAGKMYDETLEQIYGTPSEDIFGESMEDMMKELFPSYTE